jgi:hypothetical protein
VTGGCSHLPAAKLKAAVALILAVALALVFLVVGLFSLPAAAQGPGAILEKPAAPESKKEAAPTTCGPIVSDSCLPIETHHASMQILWALSFYPGNFSPNWRYVNAHGNFYTFNMPVKFTYGPTKNLETYIIVPFVQNWANDVNKSLQGPNGERSASYGGIGDISLFGKYLLLEETPVRPAVTGVAGLGIPTGHASNLNPRFLGQDAIGTGAVDFTTGINLYKWLKPFLVYSNIWLTSPVNLYPSRDDTVRCREFVTFNLAAEYPLAKRWTLLLEMYSTWTWSNIYTPLGFQSPSTLLGVLPGIEYLFSEKWSFSAGTAFDLVGKFGGRKFTPLFTVYYNF